jgi:hypothetical protein
MSDEAARRAVMDGQAVIPNNRVLDVIDLVERLGALWLQHPALRLGQLIANVYQWNSGLDPYNVPDEEFITSLEHYYEEVDRTAARKGV